MKKETLSEFISIDCKIIAMCDEVAIVKKDDKFALVELVETTLGSKFYYHYKEKYECNLIFVDYYRQVLEKGSGVLNFELVNK